MLPLCAFSFLAAKTIIYAQAVDIGETVVGVSAITRIAKEPAGKVKELVGNGKVTRGLSFLVLVVGIGPLCDQHLGHLSGSILSRNVKEGVAMTIAFVEMIHLIVVGLDVGRSNVLRELDSNVSLIEWFRWKYIDRFVQLVNLFVSYPRCELFERWRYEAALR